MSRWFVYCVLFVSASALDSAAAHSAADSGDMMLEYHTLQSRVFQNSRTLRVLLPGDYYNEGNERAYKVLFLNDGQCLFNTETCRAFNREWRVDETADSLFRLEEIESFIVVGIDHAGLSQRGNEYLPWVDIYLDPPIPDPKGSFYPEFLFNDVIPFVEERYRISTKREDVGLGGSSYGALIALYTYLKQPDRIGFLLLESPSFYVNDQAILTMFERYGGRLPNKLYLGIGTNELGLENCNESNEDNLMAVRDAEAVYGMFLSKSSGRENGFFVAEPCATHSAASWARRFPDAIRFLMGE